MNHPCNQNAVCPGSGLPRATIPELPNYSCISNEPIGMGYVPMQKWGQTYPVAKGFQRGTIFPELDLAFMYGGCKR